MPPSQEPVRRCIACGKLAPRHEFFRLVRQFETRQVQLNRGMGRSAYVCRDRDCLRRSQKKNRLGKALRTSVPPEIYNQLQALLVSDSHKGDRVSAIPASQRSQSKSAGIDSLRADRLESNSLESVSTPRGDRSQK